MTSRVESWNDSWMWSSPACLERRDARLGQADAGGDQVRVVAEPVRLGDEDLQIVAHAAARRPKSRIAPRRARAPRAARGASRRSASSASVSGEIDRVVAEHAMQRAAVGQLGQQPQRRPDRRLARCVCGTALMSHSSQRCSRAPDRGTRARRRRARSCSKVAPDRRRSSADRAHAVAALEDLAGAAVELDHAFRIQQHVRVLRRLPLQAEAARRCAARRVVGRRARSLASPVARSAMASFIVHRMSSLNCRISSARSCAARRAEVVERDRQRLLDVAARQGHAAAEILEPRRLDPRIVLAASWRGAPCGSSARTARSATSTPLPATARGARSSRRRRRRSARRARTWRRLSTSSRVESDRLGRGAARPRCRRRPRRSRRGRGCAAPSRAASRGPGSWRGSRRP